MEKKVGEDEREWKIFGPLDNGGIVDGSKEDLDRGKEEMEI